MISSLQMNIPYLYNYKEVERNSNVLNSTGNQFDLWTNYMSNETGQVFICTRHSLQLDTPELRPRSPDDVRYGAAGIGRLPCDATQARPWASRLHSHVDINCL